MYRPVRGAVPDALRLPAFKETIVGTPSLAADPQSEEDCILTLRVGTSSLACGPVRRSSDVLLAIIPFGGAVKLMGVPGHDGRGVFPIPRLEKLSARRGREMPSLALISFPRIQSNRCERLPILTLPRFTDTIKLLRLGQDGVRKVLQLQ